MKEIKSTSTSCFSLHTIVYYENGDLFSFGINSFGQCGLGNTKNKNILKPTKVLNNPNIKSIILGVHNSFYLEKNGDLYGCGYNPNGQLGIPNNNSSQYRFAYVTSNVKKVFASYEFTLIQKDDGKIYFSGLWNGINKQSMGFVELKIENVESFSCGGYHALFIKSNKEIWSMGANDFGQCGFERNIKFVSEPRLLTSDKNIISVCCGYSHSFFLTKNKNGATLLKCFGKNDHGQLGLNHKMSQFGMQTIHQHSNILSVHCGGEHSFILNSDGNVLSCGRNDFGQLGLGNTNSCLLFSKTNLTSILYITTGYFHTMFINDKKEMLACGSGNSGRLGLTDENDRNVACKLDVKEIKVIQNSNYYSQTYNEELEVNFIFEMKIEGEKEKRVDVKKKIDCDKILKEILDEIWKENNFFNYDDSQTKYMLVNELHINNLLIDRKEIEKMFIGWVEKNNKVRIVYHLPQSRFAFNEFSKEKENEINKLKETVLNLEKQIQDPLQKNEETQETNNTEIDNNTNNSNNSNKNNSNNKNNKQGTTSAENEIVHIKNSISILTEYILNFEKKSKEEVEKLWRENELLKKKMAEIKNSNSNFSLEKENKVLRDSVNKLQETLLQVERERKLEREKVGVVKGKMEEQMKKFSVFFSINNEKNFKSSDKEKVEKNFFFAENLKDFYKCGVCESVLKNPQLCPQCDQCCCKKCCVNDKFCPFEGCTNEEMEGHVIFEKRINNLIVICSFCNQKFKFCDFDKHFSEHKFPCRFKEKGCGVVERRDVLRVHERECKFFLECLKKERETLFDSLYEFFSEYINNY